MTAFEDWLAGQAAMREDRGLTRQLVEADRSPLLDLAGNDYLGLAARTAPPVATGAGASRLIVGEHAVHGTLERALSAWLGVEATLLFTSGYAANLGTVAALAGPNDLIVSDALNHASLIDGARLSQAKVVVVPHNDLAAVEAALVAHAATRRWVLVESYYSMDADGPDLLRLREVCDRYGAGLIVDEAHALGVLGPGGRGRCAEAGVVPDVLVGTLGKAFGSQGAFVSGTRDLRDWLWNRARSFVFSTGLSPAAAEAGRLALQHIQQASAEREHVARLAGRLRAGLARVGRAPVVGFGHIVPVVIGDGDVALALAAHLKDGGIDVPAIRPPTVPRGAARLRFTVTAAHDAGLVDELVEVYQAALSRLGQ